MDSEFVALVLLLGAILGLMAATIGRDALFAIVPLLVTLNGIAVPTPAGMIRMDQLAGLVIGLGLVVGYLLQPSPLAFDRTMRRILALLVVSVFSSITASPDQRYSLAQLVNYFSAIWLYAVVVMCTDGVEAVDRVTSRFLVAGIVGGLVGILAFVLGISGMPVGGANVDATIQGLAFGSYGTMREPNIFGNFCQIFFVFGVAVLQLPSAGRGAVPTGRLLLLIAVSATGLVLSFTRGAWIGAFAGLGAVAVLNYLVFGTRIRIARVLAPVAMALVAGFIVWNVSEGAEEFMRDKLMNLFNPASDNAAIRLLLYARALDNIQQRPWLGWGTYSFAPTSVSGIDVRLMGNEHDVWLGNYVLLALHDTGIVGLVIFGAILWSVLRPAVRVAKGWAHTDPVRAVRLTALVASFGSLLVSFLPSSGFTFGYPWLMLGIIGAYVWHAAPRARPDSG